MLMVEVIRKKRDGEILDPKTIEEVIFGFTKGEIPEYQMSAFLMAVFLRGLNDQELASWANAMIHSGKVISFEHISGPKIDKHSTGGVGDKISIPLAPLVASLGVKVPMISGRGLGHTGGTLDKLESIPGFRTDLSVERFIEGVEKIGVCMIGQTEEIAPADKKIYALRDVTATVESIPLISASIMSKKLAEGISGLVLDVKVGSGAFMKTIDKARDLASKMINIGKRNGVSTKAVLTNMDQPIGWAVGNSLEIEESIEVLRGEGPEDTVQLVRTLGGVMLLIGGMVSSVDEGEKEIEKAIKSGQGLLKFREMIEFQGGNPEIVDKPTLLPKAKFRRDVIASKSGYVTAIDCESLGMAVVILGGGRQKKEDKIDPSVGLRVYAKIGDYVEKGDTLVTICYNNQDIIDEVESKILNSYNIGVEKVEKKNLILEIME